MTKCLLICKRRKLYKMKISNTIKISTVALSLLAVGSQLPNWQNHTRAMEVLNIDDEEKEELIHGAVESMYSMRLNEKTGTIEYEWVAEAISKAYNKQSLNRRLNKAINWTNLGPDNIGGRVRALQFDKDSLRNMWLGCVSGGMWKSNTSGQSWYPVTAPEQNQHVTAVAQTPDGTVYYGTGEGGFTNGGGNKSGSPAFLGDGIYKSVTRAGESFERITNTNTPVFRTVNAMKAHPTKDEFYVATESGLYKFTNGGSTNTLIVPGGQKEVEIQTDGTIWCAAGNGLVRKSDATGANFQIMTYTSGSAGGRVTIGISEQDENYVYLLGADSNNSFAGVWRTKDGGSNWTQIIAPTSPTNPINNIFGSNNQGYYDNCIGVDPFNKDHIYLGGVGLAEWDPVNGYTAMASLRDLPWSTSYVHADKHIITWDRRNNGKMMYIGCDGGLFRSNDRVQWQRTNRDFVTLQFYNVAANYIGHVGGGTQDNGSNIINGNGNSFNGQPTKTGHEVYGVDGFDFEYSRYNPSVLFASTYYGDVARSSNGGQSMSSFWDQRVPQGIQSDFNTTYTLWESPVDSSSLLFLAKNNEVWLATNVVDFTGEVTWFKAATNLGNGRIFELDMTPDGYHLFFTKQGKVYRIDNIQSADLTIAGSQTFNDIPAVFVLNDISSGIFAGRSVTSVNVDQANGSHVVITCGGYGNTSFIFESKNALDANPTWTNITGDFIGVPVYDAVIDIDDPKRIILATDWGIWVTEDGGVRYEEANNGMARVPVWEISGYEWNSWQGMQLYIGTHGRGFYKSISLLTNTKKVEKSLTKLIAYPNPARTYTNIAVQSKLAGTGTVEVFDLNGRKVSGKTININVGSNTFNVSTDKLSTGTYFVRVLQGGSAETVKVFVQ